MSGVSDDSRAESENVPGGLPPLPEPAADTLDSIIREMGDGVSPECSYYADRLRSAIKAAASARPASVGRWLAYE
jgi:hypothetical protein